MFQRTSVASMPARTTGASGASAGQAILAAAQSAFFQQQAQQSQPQPQQPHGPPPGKNKRLVIRIAYLVNVDSFEVYYL